MIKVDDMEISFERTNEEMVVKTELWRDQEQSKCNCRELVAKSSLH